MERITRKMLEFKVQLINKRLGRPSAAYTCKGEGQQFTANIGNFHIEANSPGDGKTRFSLLEMHSAGGGVLVVGNRCFIGASSFYDFLVGFHEGLERSPDEMRVRAGFSAEKK